MDDATATVLRRGSFLVIGGVGLIVAPEPTAAALVIFLAGLILRAVIRGYRQTTA